MINNIGTGCVYQGACKQNTPIEGFWRILHHGCIWIFRLQLYHLQQCHLLDNVNPLHLSCVWFTFSHDVQDAIDEFISTYNAKLMYVTLPHLLMFEMKLYCMIQS